MIVTVAWRLEGDGRITIICFAIDGVRALDFTVETQVAGRGCRMAWES